MIELFNIIKGINLQSLEHRHLLFDLIFCYKIVFGIVDVPMEESFTFSIYTLARGHKYKLYKNGLTPKKEQTVLANKS